MKDPRRREVEKELAKKAKPLPSPEEVLARKRKARDYNLRRRYNITLDDYEVLLKKQKGKCAVCERHHTEFKQPLHVDHSHRAPYEVRGLLCNSCNTQLIGRHHDPLLFEKAAKYLRGPFTGHFAPKRTRKKRK